MWSRYFGSFAKLTLHETSLARNGVFVVFDVELQVQVCERECVDAHRSQPRLTGAVSLLQNFPVTSFVLYSLEDVGGT